jgi:hypothetical protein
MEASFPLSQNGVWHGANSVPIAAKQNYARESQPVAVEEGQEAPDVILDIFLDNATSTIMLFDLGASHSFIYVAYVEKNILPIALLKCQMIISSPGGDIPIRQLCPKVNLKIKGVNFVANLIVLESKGINVILRMDWLSKHKALIDYPKKSIKLVATDEKELEYVAEPIVIAKGAANHVKLNQLDVSQGPVVPVVNEFPDIFLEDLSSMQPDRDNEFMIDLVLGTVPIYKRPYRMAT